MSTRNSPKKLKQKSTSLVKTDPRPPPGPFGEAASHFLPGTSPIAERISHITSSTQQTFNGPIPHPDIFRKYGEVINNAPERILRVFEEDSKHLRDIQMGALNGEKNDNRRLHWMAWSLIAGGYGMSALFAWMDKDILAGAILTTTIVGTVTGFLQSQKSSSSKD